MKPELLRISTAPLLLARIQRVSHVVRLRRSFDATDLSAFGIRHIERRALAGVIPAERLGEVRRRDDFKSVEAIRREESEDARIAKELRGNRHEIPCIKTKDFGEARYRGCLVGREKSPLIKEINPAGRLHRTRGRDYEMDRLPLDFEPEKILAIFVLMLNSDRRGMMHQCTRVE